LPTALLGATVVLWGVQFQAVIWASDHATGLALAAIRALVAGLALSVFATIGGSRWPDRRLWPWAIAGGIVMVAINGLALMEGTPRAGPANMAVLVNAAPFVILVLAAVFLRERVTRGGVAGLLVGFAGIVLLVWNELGAAGAGSDLVLGVALGGVACVSWSVGTVMVKWLSAHADFDPVGFAAATFVVAAPLLIVLACAVDPSGTRSTDWESAELWANAAFIGLGATALGTVMYFTVLRLVPANTAGAWLFLPPVVAILGEVVMGEPQAALSLFGLVLAVAGVLIVSLAQKAEAEQGAGPAVVDRR